MKQPTKTEKSKSFNTVCSKGFHSLDSCSQKYISKPGKAMTTENSKFSESCEDTDEMLISVQESRDKYVKDLQQENARLKQENFYLNEKCLSYFKEKLRLRQALEEIIPWLDKHFPIMSSRTRKEFKSFINKALKSPSGEFENKFSKGEKR